MPSARILCLTPEMFTSNRRYMKAVCKLRSSVIRGEKMNEEIFNIRISHSDRLLFTIEDRADGAGIDFILFEIVLNHDYQKSAFLKAPSVLTDFFKKNRERLVALPDDDLNLAPAVVGTTKHMLMSGEDPRFIQWDLEQKQGICEEKTTLLTGVAGSGKTAVLIERMQETLSHMPLSEQRPILYVAEPKKLVRQMRVWWSELCTDFAEDPRVLFLTFDELLQHLNVISHQVKADHAFFLSWYTTKRLKVDPLTVYEEFRLISIYAHQGNALTIEDYIHCGDKHSFFPIESRCEYFTYYHDYQHHLAVHGRYDPGFLDTMPRGVFFRVFIDEALLLTLGQWLSLEQLSVEHGNCFATDSLQALLDRRSHRELFVHLYRHLFQQDMAIVQLSSHYRCPPKVVAFLMGLIVLRKRVLKGLSYDHFEPTLIESSSLLHSHEGFVQWIKPRTEVARQLADEISAGVSDRAASTIVIVLHEDDKRRAREVFNTEAIFTIEESVGLSLPCVLLFDVFNQPDMKTMGQLLQNDVSFTEQERERLRTSLNALFVAASRSSGTLLLYGDMKHHLKIVQEQWSESTASTMLPASAAAPKEQWLKTIALFIKNGNEKQAQETFQRHFPEKNYHAFREEIVPIPKKEAAIEAPMKPVRFISVQKLMRAFAKHVAAWFQQENWLHELARFQEDPQAPEYAKSFRASLLYWIMSHPENATAFIKHLELDDASEHSKGLLKTLLIDFREEMTENTALHVAVNVNSHALLRISFGKLTTVMTKNALGRTALDFAISQAASCFSQAILIKGVELGEYFIYEGNVVRSRESPPLFSCVELEMDLLAMLEPGKEPPSNLWNYVLSTQDDGAALERAQTLSSFEEKSSALLSASQYGLFRTVEYLVSKGADPFFQSVSGLSPAYLAVQYGHFNLLQLFLSLFNHSIQPPQDAWSPFKWAVYYNDQIIFGLLLGATNGLDELCPNLTDFNEKAFEPVAQLADLATMHPSLGLSTKLQVMLKVYHEAISCGASERSQGVTLTKKTQKLLLEHSDVFFGFINSHVSLRFLWPSELIMSLINRYLARDRMEVFQTKAFLQSCIERNDLDLLERLMLHPSYDKLLALNPYDQTVFLGLLRNRHNHVLVAYEEILIKHKKLERHCLFMCALVEPFFIKNPHGVHKTTLLHMMIEHAVTPALLYSLIKLLSTERPDHQWLDYQESCHGLTPLMLAVSLNLSIVTSVLLKKCRSRQTLCLTNHDGYNLLGIAIVCSFHDIAKTILTTYPFLATTIMSGTIEGVVMTPLMLAAYYGNDTMTRVLLDLVAHTTSYIHQEAAAYHIATAKQHEKVVSLFETRRHQRVTQLSSTFFTRDRTTEEGVSHEGDLFMSAAGV